MSRRSWIGAAETGVEPADDQALILQQLLAEAFHLYAQVIPPQIFNRYANVTTGLLGNAILFFRVDPVAFGEGRGVRTTGKHPHFIQKRVFVF